MKEIITTIEQLREPAEQLVFIDAEGNHDEEIKEIINDLQEVFDSDVNLVALAAPQIGINKRIFGMRFDNEIKYFINPIITKKEGQVVAPEYFASMPGKEILIGRPKEVRVIYYTKELKYEDNKLLDIAARVFDQMSQVLDGVLPCDLGLVSDIKEDGSFFDLTEEEMNEACSMWKEFITKKLTALEEEIKADEDVSKVYKSLLFTESVINGGTIVSENAPKLEINSVQKLAAEKLKNKAELKSFLGGKK